MSALLGEELLFAPLCAAVAQRVFRPFAGRYDIVSAALGEGVVVHGALAWRERFYSPIDRLAPFSKAHVKQGLDS